jgi:tetratricopeptide (TPR) repeat protein
MSDQVDQVQVTFQENGQTNSISQDEAIHMLDSIGRRDVSRALHYFYKLCSDNPKADKLLWNFYDTLMNLVMFDQLLEVTNERLQKVANCPIALIWKIETLQRMSRHQEATTIMEQMVAGSPSDYKTLSTLGTSHKQAGNNDKAIWCFNRAIEQNRHFAAPYWLRADISDTPQKDLQAVETLIASNQCADDQQHYLHFAASHYAERLQQFDQAFQHLQFANSYKRRSFEYDVNDDLAADLQSQKLFNQDFINKFSSPRKSELRPIFIMGLPRSGTALVEQILSSHSDISAGDEYTALANAIRKSQLLSKSSMPIEQWVTSRHQADWDWIGTTYESHMRFARGQNNIFTDRNQFNYRSIGIIKAALPNAKIIVVDRDPRDLCLSMYRQLFASDDVKFGYQFDEMVKAIVSYQRLMSHWQEVTDSLILRVSYEDIVADLDAETNKMLSFCDLDSQSACYNFHQNQRVVKTVHSTQLREPLFTHGVARWKTYQAQLQPLQTLLNDAGLS